MDDIRWAALVNSTERKRKTLYDSWLAAIANFRDLTRTRANPERIADAHDAANLRLDDIRTFDAEWLRVQRARFSGVYHAQIIDRREPNLYGRVGPVTVSKARGEVDLAELGRWTFPLLSLRPVPPAELAEHQFQEIFLGAEKQTAVSHGVRERLSA